MQASLRLLLSIALSTAPTSTHVWAGTDEAEDRAVAAIAKSGGIVRANLKSPGSLWSRSPWSTRPTI